MGNDGDFEKASAGLNEMGVALRRRHARGPREPLDGLVLLPFEALYHMPVLLLDTCIHESRFPEDVRVFATLFSEAIRESDVILSSRGNTSSRGAEHSAAVYVDLLGPLFFERFVSTLSAADTVWKRDVAAANAAANLAADERIRAETVEYARRLAEAVPGQTLPGPGPQRNVPYRAPIFPLYARTHVYDPTRYERIEEERLLQEIIKEEAHLPERVRRERSSRRAEEARLAQAAQRVEEARLVEEARRAEAARRVEEARLAEEAQRAEAARRVEEARLAEEAARHEEEARLAAAARRAEAARQQRLVEEARLAEAALRAQEDARSATAKALPVLFRLQLSASVETAYAVARDNDARFLFLPGMRWVYWIGTCTLCIVSALMSVLGFGSDLLVVGAYLYEMLGGAPLDREVGVGFSVGALACAFVIFLVWHLRKEWAVLQARDQSVRNDPRVAKALNLGKNIAWWNTHLPKMADLLDQLRCGRTQPTQENLARASVYVAASAAIELENDWLTTSFRSTQLGLMAQGTLIDPPDSTSPLHAVEEAVRASGGQCERLTDCVAPAPPFTMARAVSGWLYGRVFGGEWVVDPRALLAGPVKGAARALTRLSVSIPLLPLVQSAERLQRRARQLAALADPPPRATNPLERASPADLARVEAELHPIAPPLKTRGEEAAEAEAERRAAEAERRKEERKVRNDRLALEAARERGEAELAREELEARRQEARTASIEAERAMREARREREEYSQTRRKP
ncbi:MAG: hypothetical protein V4850_16255 [Myxococcota bacterium]